jgi:hypothetical protein
MTAPDRRLSFGIKTSQMGLSYEEILRIWREADQIPVFGHAWLWDHMVPLRGDITGAALEAWTLLAALAAVLAGRPVQWLADEIIEPVLAEAQLAH